MISIIMGTYNGERYIKEQIISILNQDFCEWKLFIFDDGSTDSTEKIALEFVKKYPDKIFYNKNTVNLGAAGNFFNGTKKALELAPENQYFCFSDQDDVWVEDKLTRSLKKLIKAEGKQKQPTLVYSDVAIADKDLNILKNSYFKSAKIDFRKTELNYLLMENKVIGGTVMFNKSLLEIEIDAEKRGLKPEKFAKMHDWWFALIASGFGNIDIIEGFTEYYRQHENNVIGGESFGIYLISRLQKVSEIRKRIRENIEQAEGFLKYFNVSLSEKNIHMIEEFIKLKKVDFFRKRIIIFKNKFLKTGLIRNLALMLFL